MEIKIKEKTYVIDLSFMVLVRFYCRYKISIFSILPDLEKPENITMLLRLFHSAIIGADFDFTEFQELLGADNDTFESVYLSALRFACEVTEITLSEKNTRLRKKESMAAESVEMSVLTLSAALEIDTSLLSIMPLGRLCELTTAISSVKYPSGSGKKKFKKLEKHEIENMYRQVK